MPTIAKGMVVELVSGGPRMSVVEVSDYSESGAGPKEGAKCIWFDSKHNQCEGVFDVAILKEASKRGIGAVSIAR